MKQEREREPQHNCAFCEIMTAHESHSDRILYQDESLAAMFVNQPVSEGHFIVFPKSHTPELSAFEGNLGEFFEKTVALAEEVVPSLNARAYVLKLNNRVFQVEEDDPGHVGHIHMHVMPVRKGEQSNIIADARYYQDLMKRTAGVQSAGIRRKPTNSSS